MKKTILHALLLASFSTFAQTDTEKLNEVMQAATDAGVFNGVVLIARHDSILLYKGYGLRNYEEKIQHDTTSVFQVGSITKQFTSTIILWLQEQHLLSIQDKLSKFYPDYPYADKITIRNLLTHTSGIAEYTDQYFLDHQGDKPYSQKDFWSVIKERPLEFEPGEQFMYSNSNYTLLGYIIEKVSGKSFEQMMKDIIFKKAGMKNSGFDYVHFQGKGKSIGYTSLPGQMPKRTRIGDSSATFAAGSLFTTAGDLYRWHKALYGNDIVQQSSLEEAFTPYKNHYGYGWNIDYINGKRFEAHNGSNWGFQSIIKRYPADGACIIVLQNAQPLTFDNYITSLERILFHESTYYIPRKTIALSPTQLQPYTGQYELVDNGNFKASITLNDEGHLYLTWSNMNPEEIYPEKKNFFHFRSYNMQIDFSTTPDGKINGFTALGPKQKFIYKRLQM